MTTTEQSTRTIVTAGGRAKRPVTNSFDTALGWSPHMRVSTIVRWVLIVIVVLCFFVPFWSVAINAFDNRPTISIFKLWPNEPGIKGWQSAIDRGVLGYLVNSLVIVGGGLLIQIMTSILASYAIARFHFKGATLAFGVFLLTMMLPEDIIAVPLSTMLGDLPIFGLNLRGTPWAVILPVAAWGFSVMLMTEFMRDIPTELEEAARLDGAGSLRILISVILPMSTPVLGVATIFGFINVWDQYLLPLIAANTPADYTLTVALRVMRSDPQVGQGVLMVGALLALIPSLIVFALLQKSLIQGVTSGAVKG